MSKRAFVLYAFAVLLVTCVASATSIPAQQQSVDDLLRTARRKVESERKKHDLKIAGTIVAEYVTLGSLTRLTDTYNYQTLLVRVDKRIGGREPSQYIRVDYEYYTDIEPRLRADVFDATKRWRFILRRDRTCDGQLTGRVYPDEDDQNNPKDPIPFLRRSRGSEKEHLPNESVPCYTLRPGNFSEYK